MSLSIKYVIHFSVAVQSQLVSNVWNVVQKLEELVTIYQHQEMKSLMTGYSAIIVV